MIRIIALAAALTLCALPGAAKDHNRAEKIIDTILSEGTSQQDADKKGGSEKGGSEPASDESGGRKESGGKKGAAGKASDTQKDDAGNALALKTAEDYYNSGMTEEALSAITAFIGSGQSGSLADSGRVLRGKIMIKKLMYDEALKDLSQVAEGSGEYTAALALSADAYRQKGERARALDYYLKAAAANPGHELAPGALLNAAGIYREMNNGQMAVETAVRLIRQYPDRATIDEAWYMLAKTFETDEKVRDLETARRLYRAFIKKAADGEPNFKGSPLLKRVQNDLNYIERKHFRIY